MAPKVGSPGSLFYCMVVNYLRSSIQVHLLPDTLNLEELSPVLARFEVTAC